MQDIEAKIKEYREYKRMIEETQKLADNIANELKAYMEESGESKMIIGEYKISYTECTRVEIDKKRLEAEQAEIYAAYLKESTYKRFSVA